MAILVSIIGAVILFGGTCSIAVWIATRVRWPVVAFFLAWVLTPLVCGLAVLVLSPFASAGNDGTWAIMLPIYGVGTGLVSAAVAAVIVNRRRAGEGRSSSPAQEPAAPDSVEPPGASSP